MGRASVPTPTLYPAFFFVLEKGSKSARNAVIPTYPMHCSHGLQGSLKRCYTPLPYFHQWVSHIKRVLAQTPTNGPRSLSQVKAGTHSPLLKESHTAAHTAKQGPSGQGRYHYPRHVLHVRKPPRAGYQNGVLCRFWVLAGCTPKNAESLGTAMRLCASLLRRRRGPAGLRTSVSVLLIMW